MNKTWEEVQAEMDTVPTAKRNAEWRALRNRIKNKTGAIGSTWVQTASMEYKVERVGTTITCHSRDGGGWTLRHTFGLTDASDMYFKASIFDQTGTLTDCQIFGVLS